MKTDIPRKAATEDLPYVLKTIPEYRKAEDGACPDAGWKSLTKEQKTHLSILARKAAVVQGLCVKSKEFEEWRHEVAIAACGVRISEAAQAHWVELKTAFELEAGEDGKAFQTQMREGDNKRRIAMHKLTQVLKDKGLDVSYAAKICTMQFKVPLDQASAKQIWCLFYTVTNRRKA